MKTFDEWFAIHRPYGTSRSAKIAMQQAWNGAIASVAQFPEESAGDVLLRLDGGKVWNLAKRYMNTHAAETLTYEDGPYDITMPRNGLHEFVLEYVALARQPQHAEVPAGGQGAYFRCLSVQGTGAGDALWCVVRREDGLKLSREYDSPPEADWMVDQLNRAFSEGRNAPAQSAEEVFGKSEDARRIALTMASVSEYIELWREARMNAHVIQAESNANFVRAEAAEKRVAELEAALVSTSAPTPPQQAPTVAQHTIKENPNG